MSKGLSIHIGIKELCIESYKSKAPLSSPENDARAMANLASLEGYQNPILLLNENATRHSFLEILDKTIEKLNEGDTFLLTFSGHGGQIKDEDGDEILSGIVDANSNMDIQDETWCFHDGILKDDEIGQKWSSFKTGVRIIVVSASCHSRSSIKTFDNSLWDNVLIEQPGFRNKTMTFIKSPLVYAYKQDPQIKASIIHISACQDKQESRDGNCFSKFTEILLKHWDEGRFEGSYIDLVSKIRSESGYLQEAGLTTLGVNNPDFINSKPFKIN